MGRARGALVLPDRIELSTSPYQECQQMRGFHSVGLYAYDAHPRHVTSLDLMLCSSRRAMLLRHCKMSNVNQSVDARARQRDRRHTLCDCWCSRSSPTGATTRAHHALYRVVASAIQRLLVISAAMRLCALDRKSNAMKVDAAPARTMLRSISSSMVRSRIDPPAKRRNLAKCSRSKRCIA